MKRLLSACITLITCTMLLGVANGVSAGDNRKDPQGLNEATAELMDANGREVLQGIMEKDEMSEGLEGDVKNVRSDALRQAAYTLALQKAVKWRYGKIRELLDKRASRLNEIFDFSPLLMHEGKVLPPAITEAGPGYRVESKTRASSTDKTYRILRAARMISRAPDWRDYLWQKYPSFNKGDVRVGVLPKNDKERQMWRRAAARGWEVGIQQAERLYRTNLNRLKQDYRGIVKFRILAEQGVVSLPVVTEGRPGIEVQGKKLSVDWRIFRITRHSAFQEVDRWKPKIGIE